MSDLTFLLSIDFNLSTVFLSSSISIIITLPASTNIPPSVLLASHLLFIFYYAIERTLVQDTADLLPAHCTTQGVVQTNYYGPKECASSYRKPLGLHRYETHYRVLEYCRSFGPWVMQISTKNDW